MSSQIAHQSRQLQQPNFTVFPGYHEVHMGLLDGKSPQHLPYRGSRSQDITASARPHHSDVVQRYSTVTTSHHTQQMNTPMSEHMLRRKTPNGTLAAAYDGSPIEWSNGPPASKMQRSVHNDWTRPNEQRSQLSMGSFQQAQNGQIDNMHLPRLIGVRMMSSDPISMDRIPTYPHCNSMHVPTVLQPAYQLVGPTASNGTTNLYGPYWPDGRREPYRPAAVRNLDCGSAGSAAAFPASVSQTSDMQSLQNFGAIGHNAMSIDQLQTLGHSHDGHSRVQIFDRDKLTSRPPAIPAVASGGGSFSFLSGSDATPGLSRRTQNVQFKERALQRSQKAYVDLLAFLHRSKKDSHALKRTHSRPSSQPSIYPKPPRQNTYANLNAHISPHACGSSNSNIARRSSQDERRHSHNLADQFQEEMNLGAHAGHHNFHFSHSQSQFTEYKNSYLHNSSGSADPHQNAKSALEMLTNLCQESEWSWVDGMLLAGCLAYGLEDYNTAVFWFSNIVELDPSHVEALSNLAASLLALNRREEAEQHWLHSVRLRPGYFEAVEHLIGLLCEDHRGNEAVGIIDFVQRSLYIPKLDNDQLSDTSSDCGRSSTSSTCTPSAELPVFDFDGDQNVTQFPQVAYADELPAQPGFGSSGYAVAGSENGRMLALVHAKGNLLYALGDAYGASRAFEDAVLISAGRRLHGIHDLIRKILRALSSNSDLDGFATPQRTALSRALAHGTVPLLLPPEKALRTASLVFAREGGLPGIRHVPEGIAKKAAISTMSNSLLSLAKIYQDGLTSSAQQSSGSLDRPSGIGDILALYYLSLSLQPSPSTANNVGILLASVQQSASSRSAQSKGDPSVPSIPGVVPGSGVALALAYYNYGLNLDPKHAHLFTNLGSLLKDIGQLAAAIKMYEQAVACDGNFDIALANLANAVKDQGRISDAIDYYRRAVASSPDFAEAVCGLCNALNSVCDWTGRGGVNLEGGRYDRWHVDERGMLCGSKGRTSTSGWMKRVVDIVGKQLIDGAHWGKGILQGQVVQSILRQLEIADSGDRWSNEKASMMHNKLLSWAGAAWEGAHVVHLVERAMKLAMRRWYLDRFVHKKEFRQETYPRPALPASLSVPGAPTVLPFHTFTCPLSAKDIRMISQRNALRISCSTLRSHWLPNTVYPPPPPPNASLNIGYVSSDFNNHPLAHLMQSVFGLHDLSRAKAFCYATTPSDLSIHREQIEREAPIFRDASTWSSERLVHQIVDDGIHILVNLNGYTRGAKNEVFAARPAPIQMSFMGFAGTLGAEWCDYLLADQIAVPPETLRPGRNNISLEDQLYDEPFAEADGWVYSENVIFCRDTFFCCDHRQSSQDDQLPWPVEQQRRWRMRKELFPSLSDDAIILGNFNQLYKIEPTTFRTWLRILAKVPNAVLWLLRFPDLGESNLKRTARMWAGEEVSSRIWFTDVAPKGQHISRARVCDLFLDTPECNAHTTAADVLWSATPLLTLPKYKYKMCSRMAASILTGALPKSSEGIEAAKDLIAIDEDQYEEFAVTLAQGLAYDRAGAGTGRLINIRKMLYESRRTSALFDTGRWVRDVEEAYHEAWRRWVSGTGGDIYL
ncbi:MAG: hypothetical protein M1818_004704 [Claussenomyces sp. TS43310]|nr:MAG: hypothetical protein M1818_004704 [Claussenomyces sp. TS43310]